MSHALPGNADANWVLARGERLLEEVQWDRRRVVVPYEFPLEVTQTFARVHFRTWCLGPPLREPLLDHTAAGSGVPSVSLASRERRPRFGTSMVPPAWTVASISRRRVFVYEVGPS